MTSLPQSLKDAAAAENGRYCSGYLDGERAYCEATFNHAVQWLFDHLMKSALEWVAPELGEDYPGPDEVNSKFFSPFKGMTEMYALQKGLEEGFESGAKWQLEQDKARIAVANEHAKFAYEALARVKEIIK